MYYALNDIIDCSREIEKKCKKTGIPARLVDKTWERSQASVLDCYKKLKKQSNKENLEYYAQAINIAGQFLRTYKEEATEINLKFLSKHLNLLNNEVKVLIPTAAIELPKPIKEELRQGVREQLITISPDFAESVKKKINTSDKGLQTEKTAAVEEFLDSKLFINLKKYRTMLANDKRDHSFFCFDFSVKNKHEALTQLIDILEKQTSMDAIRNVLKLFYKTKDTNYSTPNTKSIYDLINTGQNIFTWLTHKKTTSITLIDSLNDYAKNISDEVLDNELTLP